MARPNPPILLKWEDTESYKWLEICDCEGFSYFAVLYQGRPFHLRTHLNSDIRAPGNTKYPKTVYANSGHAFRLAEKLNEMFNTTDFTVHRLNNGPQIK